MRPFANMLADRAAMADVAAYIRTFPDKPPERTVSGDPERGERLYRTCAACHGKDGGGDRHSNAPRLAGMNDWYLVRQLEKFQAGIRGDHPDDMYGWQMVEMSKVLVGDSAIRDVVSYINTLPRGGQTVADASAAGRNE
jgi:cytochrome c oxidase subunit 2